MRTRIIGKPRLPRAAGRARHRRSKGIFLYIKVESCNFLAKYFCIIKFVRAPKASGYANAVHAVHELTYVCTYIAPLSKRRT